MCVSDGVFTDASTGQVDFISALIDNPADSAAVQARVRRRVLAAYRRRGWLDADSAADMAQWQAIVRGGSLPLLEMRST